jgi:hypothetical protein
MKKGAVALTTEKSWSGSFIFAVLGAKLGKIFNLFYHSAPKGVL